MATTQRRQREEDARKDVEPKIKIKTFSPELTHPHFDEGDFTVKKSADYIPVNVIAGSLAFILSSVAFFLIFSSKFLGSWINTVVDQLNILIVYGSFFVLIALQGACTIEGAVLSSHYYKISLQDDWTAFYSLELLIVLASLFALFDIVDRMC
jgi:hypothetical protein